MASANHSFDRLQRPAQALAFAGPEHRAGRQGERAPER